MQLVDNGTATGASRWQSKLEQRPHRSSKGNRQAHIFLSPSYGPRTSIRVTNQMFDMTLRAMRRDRAFRNGPALFLAERTFDDVLERIDGIRREFRSALLIGCPDASWPQRLAPRVGSVMVVDPGLLFSRAAGGSQRIEDEERLGAAEFDLCVAIGTLDTVNDLPLALANIRAALGPDALLIGAMSGGDTLPRLRSAMRAADQIAGGASPRIHPRVDGPALCSLLTNVGYSMPVVDIDRVQLGYRSLRALVADLRAMAATNILVGRARKALNRCALAAAEECFSRYSKDGRVSETVEILHFAGWTPAAG